MSAGRTRIKDIAKLAGVSTGTVDRVLHKRGEVAEKTSQRVSQLLKETNYSPNVMARVLKSRKGYHLVSLLPETSADNTFWEKHSSGIKEAVEELDLFDVTLSQVTFDMLDEKDFQKKTRRVLNLNPDGVLLAPIFKSESTSFCALLKAENIPFVFVDGYIEKTDFLAYIGEDMYRSGRVAGQLIDLFTPVNKDILIVNIARDIQNVHHLNNRTNGCLSYLKESGANRGRKLKINIPDPSAGSIRSAIDRAFAEAGSIGSIFISGSKAYLIASYLEQKGSCDISLIGYDLLDKNVKYLKSGFIRFLIGQRPEEQAYKAVRKLFDYLSLRKVPEKMEYLPVDIITSENVDFFI